MHCPICNSSQIKILYSVDANQSSSHFAVTGWIKYDQKRKDELEREISNMWDSGPCNVLECSNCGYTYTDPSKSGTKRFYELAFDPFYPENRWEYDLAIASIGSTSGFQNYKYLEIGSGTGEFIKKLIDINIKPINISAMEYSIQGLKRLKSLGVNIKSNKFQKYHTILLFQVFEHIDNPIDFIKYLHRILYKNGLVYISFPNPRLTRIVESCGGLLDMPPNHVNQNTIESFQKIISGYFNIKKYELQDETNNQILSKIKVYKELQNKINAISVYDLPRNYTSSLLNYFKLYLKLLVGVKYGSTQYYELTKI